MNTIRRPSRRLARWIEEFQEWKLKIKYRRGSEATLPDALSRRPDYKQRGSDAVVPALLKLGSAAVGPDALSRNYRQGSEKVPDALPKKPDYMLNVMQALASHEEYVTYMEEYLISGALPKNKFNEQRE